MPALIELTRSMGDGPSMSTLPRPASLADARFTADRPVETLFAYASPAVARGIEGRLRSAADLTSLRMEAAVEQLLAGNPCDVLLVCPYATDDERSTLLAAARIHPGRPVVIALDDADDGLRAEVLDDGRAEPGADDARQETVTRILRALLT